MKTYEKSRIFADGTGVCVQIHNENSEKQIEEHLHEFVEIVYILSGSGIHGIDGVEYAVSRGSLLFINYRQVHYFRGDMKYANILIEPSWISEKLMDTENAFELLTLSAFNDFQALCDGRALVRFEGNERKSLEILLEQMNNEYRIRKIGCETMLKAQINILLTTIFRKMLPDADSTDLAEYIRTHCDEKLTLQALAQKSFYNPSYFSRLFRELYGMTVTEYINQIRIERAKELLLTTNYTAQEISGQVGYAGKSAFYKKFSELTGVTPNQFRQTKKESKV